MVGHDASEDARTALELAQYFINQGPMKVAKLNLENFQGKQPAGDNFTTQPEGRSQTNRLSDYLKANCSKVDGFLGRPSFHCGSLVNKLGTHDQKAVLLGTSKAMKELIHQEAWHKIECKTDKEVVQQAQTEIPVASLSLSHFTSYSEYSECNLNMKIHEGLLHEKPYVRIEYALPESAHLAVLTLNGSTMGRFPITVQRPIKESTLDCDRVLKKLENDIINGAVIYVSGIQQTLTKKHLNDKFSKFGHVEAIIYPGGDVDAKPEDCFIKYGSLESALKAQAAMNGQEVRKQRLNVLRALTPYHLQSWVAQRSYTALNPRTSDPLPLERCSFEKRKEKLSQCEQELKNLMSTIDRRAGRLFRALPSNTLCMVLLPGTNSAQCSAPGLCLLEIKQDP
ncbi:RNA exonuclease 5 isoform X2 [Rhincodon typus]|uniref:RNA exonuclease 5 isoform X2 n=1 Tax=Rhincodon typus TaxID=259920 RepID=UPI002030908B|nr:RNA exonuclease 5 isoform X2 [Rhincodon typus]